jgi:glycosyltransferase involved in cell wall biosynthesis
MNDLFNILMITTSYPRTLDDTSAPFIASIAEGIAQLGHNVDVVLPYHPMLTGLNRNGVTLHPYRFPGDEEDPVWGYAQSLDADVRMKKKVYALAPFAMHRAFKLALKIADTKRPDIVHAHWVLPNGFIGARLSKKLRVPLMVSLHGSDMYLARKSKLFGSFARYVFKRAAVITACSPDLQMQASKLSKREVNLLPYGVDTNAFAPKNLREGQNVLAVGRLVHKKGFLELIDAFGQASKYDSHSMLTIVGSGPLMSELRERASKNGIAERVHLPGNIGRAELPSVYAGATIVAVPSVLDQGGNQDGLPNVFLEALASGCAIVASDIPGIVNVVQNRKECLVVPAGNIAALSEAIVELLRSPDLRQQLGVAARIKAEEELSWQRKCQEFVVLYRRLLAGKV